MGTKKRNRGLVMGNIHIISHDPSPLPLMDYRICADCGRKTLVYASNGLCLDCCRALRMQANRLAIFAYIDSFNRRKKQDDKKE